MVWAHKYSNNHDVFQKPKRNYFRILLIRLRKRYYRKSTNYPFVSGDSISRCCDYYAYGWTGDEKIDLERLGSAQSIFVEGHKLRSLLLDHANIIRASVLVSGNSDENFIDPLTLPPSIKLFLCQNNTINDDVRHTLPIGIENIRLGRSGLRKFHFANGRNQVVNKVLVPPMSPTNDYRKRAIEITRLQPSVFVNMYKYLPSSRYFKMTKKFKFILALEGNGFENHRIWESLYQDSFPVMITSPWSVTLKEYGFPILFVDHLDQVTPTLLSNFYAENKNFDSAKCKALWVPFWRDSIRTGVLSP
jgi:hypothetical protein